MKILGPYLTQIVWHLPRWNMHEFLWKVISRQSFFLHISKTVRVPKKSNINVIFGIFQNLRRTTRNLYNISWRRFKKNLTHGWRGDLVLTLDWPILQKHTYVFAIGTVSVWMYCLTGQVIPLDPHDSASPLLLHNPKGQFFWLVGLRPLKRNFSLLAVLLIHKKMY